MSHNIHNSECVFLAEIPAYLYDEIGKKEKSAFETHMSSCAACTDGLADAAFARFSVREWRDAHFAQLETPPIKIPFEPKNENLTDLNVSESLLDRLRRLISLSPAWTAVCGAAVLAIGFGLFFAASNIFQTADVAIVGSSDPAKISLSPTTEIAAAQPKNISAENANNEISPENPPKPPNKNIETPRIETARENKTNVEPKTAAIKTGGNARREKPLKQYSAKLPSGAQTASETIKQSAVSPTGRVPILSSFEDEEDNTLRLAELFEDIDSD